MYFDFGNADFVSQALPVPDQPSHAKCRYDQKIINVLSEQKDLKNHSECEIRKRAVGALPSQPSIMASVSNASSFQEKQHKTLFLHCLKIVLDVASFRSSYPFSSKRGLYSKMFPDSQLSAIRCGRSKASYIVNEAIAPFCREEITASLVINSNPSVTWKSNSKSYKPKVRGLANKLRLLKLAMTQLHHLLLNQCSINEFELQL